MKLYLSLLFICVVGCAQAQSPVGFNYAAMDAFTGIKTGQIFRSIVLQSEAEKLLVRPDLSDDLRLRVLDSIANAEEGFDNCSTTATLPWMQIRCSAFQLKKSKNELKAIENELNAKALTTPNAAPAKADTLNVVN